MFLDMRVYQGSSGKVYPNPFTDRISDTLTDRQYRAVYLENEYVRLMILPEIGGRIHIGQDKTNGYDFFYRQNVIKPALVGLMGPWISGGVEFNWPQHHRPTTFMPVEHAIEEHPDGSRTVWLSEHEPMNRMKGMVGICLHPGKSIVEAKVRLYNRTPFVQTFLWWANVGIRVHDEYQSFFPQDVTFVADHAKRAMSSFPIARNFYYGVDYTRGVDLSWYSNIPVPTSYMVTKSEYDFFGGYDHSKRAGLVHHASRHIAPGKKQWTWGNHEFGYAWDRELTDADGPYIELMAGVYTDNQPDFSFLQPGETKTFSQVWYPIREIGPVKNANRLVAVNLERAAGGCKLGLCATEPFDGVRVVLNAGDSTVFEQKTSVSPGNPFVTTVAVPGSSDILLRIIDEQGVELIRYKPEERSEAPLPAPATEPPAPEEIASCDELFVTGLHLEQYRHATRKPQPYWEEALRRDPGDARCNNALGFWRLRRGEYESAERHFRAATDRLTLRNPNPCDGEPFYNLGLTLRAQSRPDEAYAAFYKSAWNYAWQSPAYYELACLDAARGHFAEALEHVERSLVTNTAHLKARNLRAVLLDRLGRPGEAAGILDETIAMDPLDFWARWEAHGHGPESDGIESEREFFHLMRGEVQTCLDIVFDYAHAGLYEDALHLLRRFLAYVEPTTMHPMALYTLGWLEERAGGLVSRETYYRAGRACPDYCFPARLEEIAVLLAAIDSNPNDARAHYYLGTLLYDKQRREEAINHWEVSVRLDPDFSIPWRNLGIAYFNVRGDAERALDAYTLALRVNPGDARLLYELDQLRKKTGAPPAERLSNLESRRDLLDQRDDLAVELVTLLNLEGRSEEALSILLARRFHPWEGGEGLVSGQYVAAHTLLGRQALASGDAKRALEHFAAAYEYPHNLGEGKHLLTDESSLDYWRGHALNALGRKDEARDAWARAASAQGFFSASAMRMIGQEERARASFERLAREAGSRIAAPVKIDYFATSLPNFLLFDDDLEKRNRIECLFQRGLAMIGLGRTADASADLRAVLARDPSHFGANIELSRIQGTVEALAIS
jgi:tetratricopeptide (TPR) repeat protein